MAVSLDKFLMAAERSVETWRRRWVRPIFDAQISELEGAIAEFASAWLPIQWPRESAQEWSSLGPLLDNWGWPLKFRGAPILRVHGSNFDEVVGELREFLSMPQASDYEAVVAFSRILLEIRQIRGRGYRYGLLSRGVKSGVAEEMTGTSVTLDAAQGLVDLAARSLLRAAEKELAVAVDPSEVAFARLVHAGWSRQGTPDGQFRELLDGDIEALDILMCYPDGPPAWFKPFEPPHIPTWRALSAMALGIIDNESPATCWPVWSCTISEPQRVAA
ncbi:MAG TPA: hypothetical protein VGH44_02340 [Candidatus Saccharimonadia bacterium]